jgi:hypothetical protein
LVDNIRTTVLRSGCAGELIAVPAMAVDTTVYPVTSVARGTLEVAIHCTVFH